METYINWSEQENSQPHTQTELLTTSTQTAQADVSQTTTNDRGNESRIRRRTHNNNYIMEDDNNWISSFGLPEDDGIPGHSLNNVHPKDINSWFMES